MKNLILVLLFLSAVTANSQTQPTAEQNVAQPTAEQSLPPLAGFFPACAKEVARFCSDKTKPNDIANCLGSHSSEISVDCKQEAERLIQGRSQAAARGGGALASFGGLNAMGPPAPLFSYEVRHMPGTSSDSSRNPAETSLTENKANIAMPVYGSKSGLLGLSLAGSRLHLGEPLTLDNGRVIAQDFNRYELGVQYFAPLPEKKSWGLRASIGYAGDKTSRADADLTYSFNATYSFPGSENSNWILLLFFSNNSSIGNYIPIPGFLYLYKTETFTGLFGFPIASMQWTPIYPWAFSLSLFGPTIQSEAAYGGITDTQIFLGANWSQQNYIPSEKTDKKDRLTFEDKKVQVGVRKVLFKKYLGEFQLGRSTDRKVYIGEGLFNYRGGSTRLNDDTSVNFVLKAKLL